MSSDRRKFRVFAGEWCHETNTFCAAPTTLSNFIEYQYNVGASAVFFSTRGTRTSFGGVIESSETYSWHLTPSMSAIANPSGVLTDECFEHLCAQLLAPLLDASEEGGAFDGIVLLLHGAMVSHSHHDAEGEILRRVRSIVGKDVPVIVSLDLHANVTEVMASHANALIACRTYPHIDFFEVAIKACALLQRSMLKEIVMKTSIAKRPTLRGLNGGRTQEGLMRTLLDESQLLEEKHDESSILVVSICAGFTASDVEFVGPSVTVTVDVSDAQRCVETEARAREIAEGYMDRVFEDRAFTSVKHLTVSEAILLAQEKQQEQHSLLVLAEATDNPGSGHYGDATNVLRGMIEAVPPLVDAVFYSIFDPEAVQQGLAIGIGNQGCVTLGGKKDPSVGGEPLLLEGTVVTLSDGRFRADGPILGGVWQNLGLSMLFREKTSGVEICVISHAMQAFDTAQLTSLGCDPRSKKNIVLKSANHFRAHFGPLASTIATVDGGGLGSFIISNGVYKNVRRPIWPLDDV